MAAEDQEALTLDNLRRRAIARIQKKAQQGEVTAPTPDNTTAAQGPTAQPLSAPAAPPPSPGQPSAEPTKPQPIHPALLDL